MASHSRLVKRDARTHCGILSDIYESHHIRVTTIYDLHASFERCMPHGDTDPKLRTGIRNVDLSDERLRYIKQLGIDDVFVDQTTEEGRHRLPITPDSVPSVERLVTVRKQIEAHGLRFAGIQSLSGVMYDEIMFGEPGAEKQIECIKRLLRNMGRAKIPILGYQWNPRSRGVIFSTSHAKRLRGGATTREFDLDEIDNPLEPIDPDGETYDESAFWERYEAFLAEVLPIAEEAGVRMALHPADPPVVSRLDGVPRLFRDVESFKRAMEAVPSDYHGLKLCLGCFSEMGEDVKEVIRYFGERDQIVFIHFRDVEGVMPRFHETFIDEGNFDEYDVVKELYDVGFDGALVPDHVPNMAGDTEWAHRARGYTIGYIRGLLKAVHSECSGRSVDYRGDGE